MNLDSVRIVNFRSIEDVTIDFSPKCKVLVGINESGKSNILKALSFLGESKPTPAEDVREQIPGEDPIEESLVRFFFSLSKAETDQLFESVSSKVLAEAQSLASIAEHNGVTLGLRTFVEKRNNGVYDVDVRERTKVAKYWSIEDSYKIKSDWEKPSKQCPDDFKVDLKSGEKVKVTSATLIYRPDFPDIPAEFTVPATTEDLAHAVGSDVVGIIVGRLPETLFWAYSDKNLLPGSINVAQFAEDPSSCLPLKSMFDLAGISDITKSISDIRGLSPSFRPLITVGFGLLRGFGRIPAA